MRYKRRIPKGRVISFDTETTGLNYHKDDHAFAFSLCNEEGDVGYFDWPVDPVTRKVRPVQSELRLLRQFAADASIVKVMHNSLFDIRNTETAYGFRWRGVIHDTLIAAHCCNSAERSYSLKDLVKKHIHAERDDVDQLHVATVQARRIAKKREWNIAEDVEADYWLPKCVDARSQLCAEYAVRDAKSTMLLWLFYRELLKDGEAWQAAYDLELQLRDLLLRMNRRGVRFDPVVNRRELDRHKVSAKNALAELRAIAGDPQLNPNSSKQIVALLHDQLGLPVLERTETGQPKTDQKTLVLHPEVPAIKSLLSYRSLSKAVTSFFTVFQANAVPDPFVDGGYRLLPHFRQSGQRTARLSCANPNFQGIADPQSSRSASPTSARTPFGPRPGYHWVAADFSQLESRFFASLSGERILLDAFATGRDLHSETSNQAWGGEDNPRALVAAKAALGTDSDRMAEDHLANFNYDIVALEASVGKKTSRSRGKAILFSRVMGGGWRSICRELRCTEAEAREFIRAFDAAVPGIPAFLKRCDREAQRTRHATTASGRKLRMFPEEYWKAGSYVVQGSAADFIKRRMVAIDEFFRSRRLDAYVVLSIHDELIFEIRQDLLNDDLLWSIRRTMEDHEGHLDIDLPVELSLIRKSWADKQKIDLPRLRTRALIRKRRR